MEPYVSLEFTPNPKTLKYVVGGGPVFVKKGVYNFPNASLAEGKSSLASALFQYAGVEGVLIGHDFVTITHDENRSLEDLHTEVSGTLTDWVRNSKPVVEESVVTRKLNEIEQRIADFIENDVKPAVAQDGGSVEFENFDDGKVYVSLHGSCNGCPSATATLKGGIERKMMSVIPEVKEVVAI